MEQFSPMGDGSGGPREILAMPTLAQPTLPQTMVLVLHKCVLLGGSGKFGGCPTLVSAPFAVGITRA
jgi:hypothetical protein